MVNGSFVFGMDDDDPSVFARTVDWAVTHGIETATFHVLTPYPGTALHTRMEAQGRSYGPWRNHVVRAADLVKRRRAIRSSR